MLRKPTLITLRGRRRRSRRLPSGFGLWPRSLAYEGGKVTKGEEGAFVVDQRLHLLADVLD